MHSLVNTNFNRTYNPNGRQNVLCDIKRLLTSRDTESQSKACGYLIDAVNKYNCSSSERARLIEYLLDNDITVFLCEATSNLDSSLFRIKEHGTTSALSHQSAYNTEQLLACLISLSSHINNKSNTILCSAFVLHALISYQPPSLDINGKIATLLGEVLDKWFELLIGGLNRIILVGENGDIGSMLLVTCQLGMDTIRLINALQKAKMPSDFVNTVLIDEQELTTLKDAALKIKKSIHNIIKELVIFNKDNQTIISTEEYGIFLKFLLSFIYENAKTEVLSDFCDFLFSKGYLITLPQIQIIRDDPTIRKVSTLVLGEMLKALTTKYLYVQDNECNAICTKDIELSEWFKNENNLPSDLTKEPLIWELLLNIIIQSKDSAIITNCMDALNMCMRDADENAKDKFAILIWSLLPNILSNALIDRDNDLADTNIIYILDLAIIQLPSDLVQSTYIKIAVLITTLYSKNTPDSNIECRNHFEYVCLKLCLLLLGVSRDHKDNKGNHKPVTSWLENTKFDFQTRNSLQKRSQLSSYINIPTVDTRTNSISILLKRALVSEELQDANKNIISIVNDIMDECNNED
ncbi:unnamed protein product, partial [Brenthis ino]